MAPAARPGRGRSSTSCTTWSWRRRATTSSRAPARSRWSTRCSTADVPIAVASNSPRAFLDQVLATAGVADRFAHTVAGDEVADPKPAPDIYLEACRRLHADPERSVALEDSPTGAQAAHAAGLYVIGVPYIPDMEVPPADLTTASLADAVVLEAVGLVPSTR